MCEYAFLTSMSERRNEISLGKRAAHHPEHTRLSTQSTRTRRSTYSGQLQPCQHMSGMMRENVRHGVSVLHASLWFVSPVHEAPPFCSAFCVRLLVRVPPGMHSAEHVVHSVHAFHVQSTANGD